MTAFRPWESHVPDALDALVDLVEQQVALQGLDIKVSDGGFIGGGSAPQVLQLGWPGFQPGYEYPSRSMSEETGNAAVSSQGALQGLAPGVIETFTIACASLVRVGTTNQAGMRAARRTAYENIKVVSTVVQGPNNLNGSVARMLMGSTASYFPIQDRRGLLTVVTFGIRCEAFAQQ
jgi:hypothetical protein